MKRHPPRATRTYTLCPYTTLCRSPARQAAMGQTAHAAAHNGARQTGFKKGFFQALHQVFVGMDTDIENASGVSLFYCRHVVAPQYLDRKSTRLNSSH